MKRLHEFCLPSAYSLAPDRHFNLIKENGLYTKKRTRYSLSECAFWWKAKADLIQEKSSIIMIIINNSNNINNNNNNINDNDQAPFLKRRNFFLKCIF